VVNHNRPSTPIRNRKASRRVGTSLSIRRNFQELNSSCLRPMLLLGPGSAGFASFTPSAGVTRSVEGDLFMQDWAPAFAGATGEAAATDPSTSSG
jgi:hypothetical protein